MKEKLRIAIITNGDEIYSWQYSVITEIKASNFSDIILNIHIKSGFTSNKLPLLYKLYLKFDNYIFSPSPNAFSKVNYNQLKKNPVFDLNSDWDLDSVLAESIDVIINFTDSLPSQKLAQASKHGIWFLTHCDLNHINRKPFALWEMIWEIPETVAVLRSLKIDTTSPITIDQTSSCTDGLSYSRNINNIYWQASSLIFHNLRLLSENSNLFLRKVQMKEGLFSKSNLNVEFVAPGNLLFFKYCFKLYSKKMVSLIQSPFYLSQWILIFSVNNKTIHDLSFKEFKKMLPKKDRFWADPFIVRNNNRYYVFFEELIYKNKLGHLSVMEIDKNGNFSKPTKILEKNYHLSYPFIFEEDGEFYMIPESSGNKDIQLYKALEFPYNWKLEKVLMENVVAVDTTIYKENGTYWLFTNMKMQKGSSKHVELFLFSSQTLTSENWTPHPLNPIVVDIKKARPAGALFSIGDKLYRPSQNCSHHYGYGLNISEIIKLDKSSYEERSVRFIEPNWSNNITSIHTLNFIDDFIVGDIKIKRRRIF